MSLFGSFAKVFSPVLGTIVGAHDNKKAVNKANAATQLGITNAKGDLNSQLATSMGQLMPWETGGQQAFAQQGDILGLHGNDPQAAALESLRSSPLFASLMHGGQDILLNNASATGGLRGGNFERGLADFSADTFSKVIQQRLADLSGISSQGLGATQFGATLGANNAQQLAGLDTGAGSANAGAILNKQAISNNMFSQLRQIATSAASGGMGGGLSSLLGPLSSIFGGGAGGGGGSIFGGSGSGYGAGGGALPNFPNIGISLPQSSAGLPGF